LGGCSVTLHSPDFPCPCKQDCAVPTHTTNKTLTAAHGMGALGYSVLFSSRAPNS